MERLGLVSQLEGELERVISLGLMPGDGSLPSEQTLAQRYGVSRSTAREALLRLATRGLVVQHPGRRTRAVALEQAVSLENLGVALHGAGKTHPERMRLLEGYFSLKREVTVELLAACCEHASEADLRRLGEVCFALGNAEPWGESRRWVEQEFELLRLAAVIADRPGHFLLIQSLERAFRGVAERVLPHLDFQAVRQWARCAYSALAGRNVQALRGEVLALLKACDERLLGKPAPDCEVAAKLEAPHIPVEPLGVGKCEPESARGEAPGGVSTNLSDNLTGGCEVLPAGGSQPKPSPTGSCHPPGGALLGAGIPSPDCLQAPRLAPRPCSFGHRRPAWVRSPSATLGLSSGTHRRGDREEPAHALSGPRLLQAALWRKGSTSPRWPAGRRLVAGLLEVLTSQRRRGRAPRPSLNLALLASHRAQAPPCSCLGPPGEWLVPSARRLPSRESLSSRAQVQKAATTSTWRMLYFCRAMGPLRPRA